MGVTRPFISDDQEINELIGWVIRNFSEKENKNNLLLEHSPNEIIEDSELKYEDYLGTKRLLLRIRDKKYKVNLTEV